MKTLLQPRYSLVKSFYDKAIVEEEENKISLLSYGTQVAEYDKIEKTLKLLGHFSQTTSRHINEFALQLGFKKPTLKQMKNEELLRL